MALIVNAGWSSGSSNKHSASCVGVAGKGLPSAYYRCGGTLQIRQNDDGSIDINENSFWCTQDAMSNATSSGGWGSQYWWFHGLYVSRWSFTIYDGPGGPSGYGDGVQVWSAGNVDHAGYPGGNPSSHTSSLVGGASTGWHRIANSIDELDHNDAQTEVYLYAGGIIDYSSTPTDSISIPAQRITLTGTGTPGIPELFEYYPWQRKIDGIWWSLNREGGTSTNAGLWRIINGSYQPMTNRQGGDPNHGFTYNNGWQKSPKSGQGA